MPLILTFFIPHPIHSVRTRVFTDPAQYDVEVNSARGFKIIKPKPTKSKKIKVDPSQFDIDENLERHLPTW